MKKKNEEKKIKNLEYLTSLEYKAGLINFQTSIMIKGKDKIKPKINVIYKCIVNCPDIW